MPTRPGRHHGRPGHRAMTTQPTLTPAAPTTAAPQLLIAALAYAVAGWPVLPLHTPTASGGCSCRRRGLLEPGQAPAHPPRPARRHHRHRHASAPGGRAGPTPTSASAPARSSSSTSTAPPASARSPSSRPATERCRRRARRAAAAAGTCTSAPASTSSPTPPGGSAPGSTSAATAATSSPRPAGTPPATAYTWITTGEPAELPEWLARAVSPRPARPPRRVPAPALSRIGERPRAPLPAGRARRRARASSRGAVKDTRNATLNRAAFRLGQLIGAGLGDPDHVADALLEQALAIGLGEREARATIASGLSAGQRHPRRTAPADLRP